MVQKYIIKENNRKLLLFFAGWACDETPFKDYRPHNMDYMICYDYRTLEFDYSIFEVYEQVNVVAWSMGVWAGGYILNHAPNYKGLTIAYNGSTIPIHNDEGIPVTVFESTLQNLTPSTLQKFLRRMCGNAQAYKAFMQITPRRDFDEIKEELQSIKERYCQETGFLWEEKGILIHNPEEEENEDKFDTYCDNFCWSYDLAFIGENDAIFPVENLCINMENNHIYSYNNSPHYDAEIFQIILEDMWKMTYDEFFIYLNDLECPNSYTMN